MVAVNLGTHSDLYLVDVAENNLGWPSAYKSMQGKISLCVVYIFKQFQWELAALRNLQQSYIRQLYKNQLSGEVPLAYWSSPKLLDLKIYNNMFEGHIPVEMEGAQELLGSAVSFSTDLTGEEGEESVQF